MAGTKSEDGWSWPYHAQSELMRYRFHWTHICASTQQNTESLMKCVEETAHKVSAMIGENWSQI